MVSNPSNPTFSNTSTPSSINPSLDANNNNNLTNNQVHGTTSVWSRWIPSYFKRQTSEQPISIPVVTQEEKETLPNQNPGNTQNPVLMSRLWSSTKNGASWMLDQADQKHPLEQFDIPLDCFGVHVEQLRGRGVMPRLTVGVRHIAQ